MEDPRWLKAEQQECYRLVKKLNDQTDVANNFNLLQREKLTPYTEESFEALNKIKTMNEEDACWFLSNLCSYDYLNKMIKALQSVLRKQATIKHRNNSLLNQ